MRIFLADDEPKVRLALRVLLTQQADWRVVGEAEDGYALEQQLDTQLPDVAIVDWRLPGFDSVEMATRFRRRFPKMRLVALSGRPELAAAAMDEGADAFISKIDPPQQLLATIARFDRDEE